MKILKHIILWVFIMAYLIIVLGFAGKEQDNVICRKITIRIHDSVEVGFVNASMIMRTINPEGVGILGKPFKSLNIKNLEDKIGSLKTVRTAEVFHSVNGELIIDIIQREPIVRVLDMQDNGFYVDREGYILPLTLNYCPHVPVVNGYIDPEIRKGEHIFVDEKKMDIMRDIFTLIQYIEQDEFLAAQIEQIYINGKQEFELVPRVGSHIIEFGDISYYELKFFKLKVLYEEGFRNTGWNQYDRINLKYVNQVVCTKR